jgi:predicted RNA methylase
MSATGRSDVRREDDWYSTPAWCVKTIWPKLGAFDTCLDPCAGEGRLLMTMQDLASSPMYRGIEINEERATLCATQNGIGCVHADALDATSLQAWHFPNLDTPYDLIITNPPYSLALEFLEQAIRSDAAEICMLLRLNFLASMKRAKFWQTHPCDVHVLPKRPSFAVFLSCKRLVELTNGAEIACGWKASYPTDAELPSKCPNCANPKLTKCTSDATEYAWFHFRHWTKKNCPSGQGHWSVLHVDGC